MSYDDEDDANTKPTRDSNGAALADGDNVTVIKDLKVKGTSHVIKRGTMVRGVRLIPDNHTEVSCSTDKLKGLKLETQWLKKA